MNPEATLQRQSTRHTLSCGLSGWWQHFIIGLGSGYLIWVARWKPELAAAKGLAAAEAALAR